MIDRVGYPCAVRPSRVNMACAVYVQVLVVLR